MKDNNITIYEALQNIKSGKYIMPAFQRQFIWNMEQIEKLWDSILLNYPISTFLFWHIGDSNVTSDTYFCNFLPDVTFDSRKAADSVNYELTSIDIRNTDIAVLDGQQRLTSLYLSLFGEAYIRPNYARRRTGDRIIAKLLIELNKSKILIDEEEYNSKKFDIKFSDKVGKISPTQFEVGSIIHEKYKDENTREIAIEEAIVNVPVDSKNYARNILQTLCKKIFDEKLIRYTEIIDMKQDDALEMFVRFNSGGKPLRKSDITMSILEAYWPSAKTEFGEILTNSYVGFDTDFIIRTSLMLYGDVVKSNINKGIVENLKNDWNKFKKSLIDLEKMLNEMKIEVSHFSSSWNVLLPIIYYIYYNSEYHKNIESIRAYLLRAIFFTYFQSGTTGKLQQMKSHINSYDYEITIEMLNQMNDLRVTEGKIEDVLNSEKGSRVAGEVLYYLNIDWINRNFKYEQDHLHPESRFDNNKPISVSVEDWKKWRGIRNRLPNLHLLEGRSNGSKNDMRLIDYYNDMNDEQKTRFFAETMIPNDISLEIECFDVFYEARKKIITEKIHKLLG
jgi:uncharacterized protein with ParB-like and HNH nuclease domain